MFDCNVAKKDCDIENKMEGYKNNILKTSKRKEQCQK